MTAQYQQTYPTGTTVIACPWRDGTELSPRRGLVAGPCLYGHDEYTTVWFPDLGAPDLGVTIHPILTTRIKQTAPGEDRQWYNLTYRTHLGQLASTVIKLRPSWTPCLVLLGKLIAGTHPEFPTTRTAILGNRSVTLQLDTDLSTKQLCALPGQVTNVCYRLDPFTWPAPRTHDLLRCHGTTIHQAIALGWAAMANGSHGMAITSHWPGEDPQIIARWIAEPLYLAA